MNALLSFSRSVDRLTGFAGRIASLLVLVATLVCVANAGLRYGAGIGSNAWLEIQTHLFGALMYLGGAHTLRVNEHIRVDVIYGSLSERKRLVIDILGLMFFLLPVTLFMLWLSWSYFTASFESGEVSGNAGGLTLWPAKLTIPMGFALLVLQGLSELVKRFAALRGLIAFDAAYEKPQQ
jgi:TRAP-type mannitol/chloroaromatic compound transport system permease small subunit